MESSGGDRAEPGHALQILDHDPAPETGVRAEAGEDARVAAGLARGGLGVVLHRPPAPGARTGRLKLYSHQVLGLSRILPLLAALGLEAIDEHTYVTSGPDRPAVRVHDIGFQGPAAVGWDTPDVAERLADAIVAEWQGASEYDSLDALVLTAGLTWREVALLRGIGAYLHQVGAPFSRTFMRTALVAHPEIAHDLVDLFTARFTPETYGPDADAAARGRAVETREARLTAAIDAIDSLEEDRVLRRYLDVVRATQRTNWFCRARETPDDPRTTRPTLALKIASGRVPGMPDPVPAVEIWVYSPRVEGVHLRFGPVARGGLRWSDRREDFRTEILGLVKAQIVKNAVIVPTGSKGGFFAKHLPDPRVDRKGWLDEGVAAYRLFIGSLLDLTDNLVDGCVVPPARVIRYDGDDPYLVVAADKGTATFSDLANAVARSYGFWLDDAFASGGSVGFDHKAMGITARGAWESVKRHFRELGVDTQREDITVAGIGDMSGDVFGNGMLLSEHLRLVAAFDHRHIFVDPDPDPARSFAERHRLFALPRSSWAEYDPALISAGGGVWPRSAKQIPVSPQLRAALALADEAEVVTPAELIRAILLAPVDLLWFGGIGTYVKATEESHADVGDRANDAIRIDGSRLRARVVGEGGNLGMTQRGRVEAARRGIHVNTDAVDNSAGVDTSDHEVNLKILLTDLVRHGGMTMAERDAVLAEMTDEVAGQVLADNHAQNSVLGFLRLRSESRSLQAYVRTMHALEDRGLLDRELECLPGDEELAARTGPGVALTSPELSVLMAYVKLALKQDIAAAALLGDPWCRAELLGYFPARIRAERADLAERHPLRREIITNRIANSLVNLGGITFVQRVVEETGADAGAIARAFLIAREVFDIPGVMRQVDDLDGRVSPTAQTDVIDQARRLLARATRWFLLERPGEAGIAAEIDRYRPLVARHAARIGDLLRGDERERFVLRRDQLVAEGLPEELAATTAGLLDAYALLDVVDLAGAGAVAADTLVPLHFAVSQRFGIDRVLRHIAALPRDDRWDALARSALRSDTYATWAKLTGVVLKARPDGTVDERLGAWVDANAAPVARAEEVLASADALDTPRMAPVAVVLRTLRSIASR